MIKVSVIVPIYNVGNYIKKTVCSLFEQTISDVEYIFVDDCSTDNSVAELQSVIDEYPNRKANALIIKQEYNRGPSHTRNLGLLKAKGQYVVFCDSDDLIDKEAYEILYKKAISHNANVVACGIKVIDSNKRMQQDLLFGVSELPRKSLQDFSKVEGGIYSSMCNKMFKREFLLNNNILFDEDTTMWEDLLTTIKARFFSEKVYIVDKPLYYYCLRSGSIIHSNIFQKVRSQVRSVNCIESFFLEQRAIREYSLLISYLKFLAKSPLLGVDNKGWCSIFPEARKDIILLRNYLGWRVTMKYLVLSYGGTAGCALLDAMVKLKNK